MHVTIPELCLVVLVGPSGCGKSTFAGRHFRPTEVVSSDRCRAMVSDDESDQSASADAFDLLHHIVAKRLARGRLTVVDATSLRAEARRALLVLARRHYVAAAALVFDLPVELCVERNLARAERTVAEDVVRLHHDQLTTAAHAVHQEGFRAVYVFRSAAQVEAATIERVRLPPNRRELRGPFDIVGDVHGCGDELEELLATLGYAGAAAEAGGGEVVWRHPTGRTALFVGDLVDRGPRVADVLRLVMGMARAGAALCVPGNHDDKLLRWLRGRTVQVKHGLEQSAEQMAAEPPEFRARVAAFLASLASHYVLDAGALVVAHAGMKRAMQGRDVGRVRDFALYGETTGETDEFGLPVRYNWAADYRGSAMVVYGHTPVPAPEWINGTINIDTGCVFGGRLTALRYPELELVSVPARRQYALPRRRFLEPEGA